MSRKRIYRSNKAIKVKGKPRIRQKKRYSKRIVALILIVAAVFYGITLFLFYVTGREPGVTVKYFTVGVIAQLWAVAGITTSKVLKGSYDKDEPYDENPYGGPYDDSTGGVG